MSTPAITERAENPWLLLIHQIPPKPAYLRVKIWRRMQRVGAVQLKSSVYVLPRREQSLEDFEWIVREIVQSGGDASVCEGRFVEGISDEQIESLFHHAREADYRALAEEARAVVGSRRRKKSLLPEEKATLGAALHRLRKRLGEIVAIDFFGVAARGDVESALRAIDDLLQPTNGAGRGSPLDPTEYVKRVWVTRTGIHVDRMASAWLIRRFIDPQARFQFVAPKGYQPKKKELRFDMFDAEFTHEGDKCTFEVLVERFGLLDPALRPIAEIVHDIDLKDAKFGRDEAPGIAQLIAGVAMANKEDEDRLTHGSAVFENLYAYFRRKTS